MIESQLTRVEGTAKQAMADRIGISRRAVAKQIAILQEKKVIRRVGGNKGGYWEVIKDE